MISIITCSINPDRLNALRDNISTTIGIEHEIISIDNRNNKYSICQAYNIGASKSKYDNLCFCHEDILFHTKDWGEKVVQILKKPECGILGVAGSKLKLKSPSPWWMLNNSDESLSRKYKRSRIVHNGTEEIAVSLDNRLIDEVVVLDGVWLCMRKEVWSKFPFDEVTLNGFHFYDLDICLQCLCEYKNYVTYEIQIEHFSLGSQNRSWVKNTILFHRKWKNTLPVFTSDVASKNREINYIERKASKEFLDHLFNNQYDTLYILKYILTHIKLFRFNRYYLHIFKTLIIKSLHYAKGISHHSQL